MKIGLIVPSSSYLPRLGAGLKASLERGLGPDIQVVVETTKHNASPETVGAAIQRFGLDPAIEVVVSPLNPGLLGSVLPTVENQELCLVALTAGEDLVVDADRHPLLFVNSFNLWQSAWLTGFSGVTANGPNAANLSCLHDSGYGMTLAFALGVEAAAGQMVLNSVTHITAADEPLQPALDLVTEVAPDLVFAMYSGTEAESFRSGWTASADTPALMWQPALVAGPLLGLSQDKTLAPPVGQSVGQWNPAAEDPFHDWHWATLNRGPNVYSVLAFEAGSLIAHADAERAGGSLADLQAGMSAASSAGPRGAVCFNDHERTTGFVTYDVAVDDDGRVVQQYANAVEAPELLGEQISLASANTEKAGWMNPYLIG